MNKLIKIYAHDFRDMSMSEDALEKMLINFSRAMLQKAMETAMENLLYVPDESD